MDGKEASALIEEALNTAMQSSEDFEPGDVLIDWVAVGYATNPDKNKGGMYPMFLAAGLMPEYRVRGLLYTALKAYSKDEEE